MLLSAVDDEEEEEEEEVDWPLMLSAVWRGKPLPAPEMPPPVPDESPMLLLLLLLLVVLASTGCALCSQLSSLTGNPLTMQRSWMCSPRRARITARDRLVDEEDEEEEEEEDENDEDNVDDRLEEVEVDVAPEVAHWRRTESGERT